MALEWKDAPEGVNWQELSDLYEAAPLGHKPAERLKLVFSNSLYRCFVYDEGRLVGAGRALADGADCSYLCDIAVMPSHQGTGLGKDIVGRLVELSRGHKKVILYAVPGKEPFYRRFGFLRMTTAMAIFEDQALMLRRGYLTQDWVKSGLACGRARCARPAYAPLWRQAQARASYRSEDAALRAR